MRAQLQWLRYRLLNNPDIAAVVGDRVRPVSVPQGEEIAALVYSLIETDRSKVLGNRGGLTTATLQVQAWHASYTDAHALSDMAWAELDGARDSLASGIELVQVINQADGDVLWDEATDTRWHSVDLTVTMLFSEAPRNDNG